MYTYVYISLTVRSLVSQPSRRTENTWSIYTMLWEADEFIILKIAE
jgi:hypothetical protein